MGNVILASKTMDAIEAAIVADGGASFRQWEQKVLPHVSDAYRGLEDDFRPHMGASILGHECSRAIWYAFRWATKPKFSGRMLRLFNRGHLEEGRFIAMLLMIGMQVYQQDANGKQYRIHGSSGHYGGSGDGVGVGSPDLPVGLPAVLEFKTHSEKYFLELKAKGVRDAKFDHFVQMQQYMRKMGITVALYAAVNKNTDELYIEIVPLNVAIADQYIDRADKIIWLHDAPAKIPNASAGWFGCKWCDHRPVCHLNAAPARNCRTCGYSEPTAAGDGEWVCKNPVACPTGPYPIPKRVQFVGCDHYLKKAM